MSDEAPPALFTHCSTVFERMRREATSVKVEGIATLVYEGYLTRLFSELRMATPYYTTVMQRLKAMGCVRQMSRGGGSSPSRWELITDPEWDAFDQVEQRRRRSDTKLGQAESKIDAHTQRLNDLEGRIVKLEAGNAVQG
jgi:hypothetical protein